MVLFISGNLIEMRPLEFWIYKGKSKFCDELNEDGERNVPDGYLDLVSMDDTIKGAFHVVDYEAYKTVKVNLELAVHALKGIVYKNKLYGNFNALEKGREALAKIEGK